MAHFAQINLLRSNNAGIGSLLQVASAATIAVLALSSVYAEEPNRDSHNWALIIGMGKYENPGLVLNCADSDVDGLADTLETRGNYAKSNIKTIKNAKGKICLDQISTFLIPKNGAAGPQKDDQVLIYFTGHGFKKPGDPGLYLAPVDFKQDDPVVTGINVKALRDLVEKCPARSKILIIDSCYSGAPGAAEASEIERAFNKMERLVTLASSSQDEESIEPYKKHALFTYWLIEALKGNADNSMDGDVTFDEVYAFVHKKVTETAHATFNANQTPVASMRFSSKGFPTVVKLKPQALDTVLNDMAEQIVGVVQGHGLSQVVSVPPFLFTSYRDVINVNKDARLDGTHLGLDCAQRFHDHMDSLDSRVKVRTLEATRRVLKAIKATPNDLGTFQGMHRIGKYFDPKIPPVVIYGELLEREPGIVQVRARAIRNDTKATLIETGGTVELKEDEWLETNKSVIAKAADYRPVLDPKTGGYKTRGIALIEQWHEREMRAEVHPNQDLSFPFRVKILVRDKRKRAWIETDCEYIRNEAYVALDKGQEYRIKVEYRDEPKSVMHQSVFLKLLVDGLNIRDQHRPEGVAESDIKTRGIEMVPQKPMALSLSSVWILDAPPKGGRSSYPFEGFYLTDDLVCPFLVGEASESRGLADQIGVITAVFYEELTTKGQGTIAGVPQPAEKPVERVPAGNIGNLIGSIQIHYVSQSELETLKGK